MSLSASMQTISHHPTIGIDVIQIPGWAKLDWLLHGFSTRVGGTTTAYRRGEASQDLNLGFTSSDLPENVAENRRRFLGAVDGLTSATLITMHQIHSDIVHGVGSPASSSLQGDGMLTSQPGLLLGIQTADCVPVLVIDRHRRIVAAFHAGWRGTVKRIVEQGVARMKSQFACASEDLSAAIGPAIGPCCYAVGEDVCSRFHAQFRYAADLFRENPGTRSSTRLDLREANRRQLLAAGLADENIHTLALCTSCGKERFFSHRAEHGHTGRMLSVVGIRQP